MIKNDILEDIAIIKMREVFNSEGIVFDSFLPFTRVHYNEPEEVAKLLYENGYLGDIKVIGNSVGFYAIYDADRYNFREVHELLDKLDYDES